MSVMSASLCSNSVQLPGATNIAARPARHSYFVLSGSGKKQNVSHQVHEMTIMRDLINL